MIFIRKMVEWPWDSLNKLITLPVLFHPQTWLPCCLATRGRGHSIVRSNQNLFLPLQRGLTLAPRARAENERLPQP